MKPTMEEAGVLKLVHPGRIVEVHMRPVTAAQVMKKNPKHCVTRPDVFKFPWIVVRPDSVLKLGTVYFIVPNHTLRRLLQAAGACRKPSLLGLRHANDQHAKEQSVNEQWLEVTPELTQSTYESWATPKREHGRSKSWSDHEPRPEQQFPIKPAGEITGKRVSFRADVGKQPRSDPFKMTGLLQDCNQQYVAQSPIKRSNEETRKHNLRDQRLRKHSPDNTWEDMNTQQRSKPTKSDSTVKSRGSSSTKSQDAKNEKTSVDLKPRGSSSTKSLDAKNEKASADLKLRSSSAKSLDAKNEKTSADSVLPPRYDSGSIKLKSCLRKPEEKARRRSQGLKVKFLLPR